MTREEAIEVIKAYRDNLTNSTSNQLDGDIKAFNMAIQALSQESCDVFDEYGNYKYPSDVELAEPNTATSMPCDDAISREAVLSKIQRYNETEGGFSLINSIKDLPSVTQKSGIWIGIDEEPHEDYECSCCGYVVSTFTANIEPHTEYKYCPNCGAKMESEDEE